jgi:uncharacterized protein
MIPARDFHVFSNEDQSYLFLTKPVAVFKVDRDTAEVLRQVEQGLPLEDELAEQRWREADAFMVKYVGKAPPSKVLRGPGDISDKVCGLYLFVAQECNLKCTYCYGNEGEYGRRGRMTEDTLCNTFNTFFAKDDGRQFITFFGGEPLMNFPLMRKTASLAEEYRQSGKADVSLGIVTNGTLCNDEITEFFHGHIDDVTFSLDGPQDLNDGQRLEKRGGSVYRTATENIRKLTAAKKFNWAFRTIVTQAGHDRVDEIYDDLEAYQPGGIGIVNVDAPKDSDLYLDDEQFRRFVDQIVEVNHKGLHSFIKGGQAVAFEYPFYILFHFITRSHALYHCNAGANLLAITAEGDVYPCHRFVGEETFKMGNVADPNLKQSERYQEIRQSFIGTTVDQREVCRDCWARYLCGGSCVKHSYAEHGHMGRPVERHCYYIKTVIERILPDIVALVQSPDTRATLMGRLRESISNRYDSRRVDASHVS